LDELFIGDKVSLAKQRAAVIGWTIQSKMWVFIEIHNERFKTCPVTKA
jgi:hypothetical protein